MLKPTERMVVYKDLGFKKCKGSYGKNGCYYLCVSRGQQMIFLSPEIIEIVIWEENDPRIHEKPNCRYKDHRTALDIVCQMAVQGLVMIEY